jgi:hypothetical protein
LARLWREFEDSIATVNIGRQPYKIYNRKELKRERERENCRKKVVNATTFLKYFFFKKRQLA